MPVAVRLQTGPFDPGAETNAFLKSLESDGAAVTFTGLVRSINDRPIEKLVLEHYAPLAERQIRAIAEKALDRFQLSALTVIHRFGELLPNEPIVQVMASAPHRHAAFDGAGFVMDWLKTDAPFWKREDGPDGSHWVESHARDEAARANWEDE
jgi:molybdopterin synthase catalytic subunit